MKRLVFALLAALAAVSLPVQAQSYPTKPVRLIIAFTPGSSTDIIGRAVAAKLAEIWGQPVVAENRTGAGGSIGSAAVLREPPDGYTLLANSSAHVANPSIYAKLPYDTLKDFANIAPLAGGPNVMFVGQGTGWKTFSDFIAAAKAKPGQLNFSSAGIGSGTHFNLEKLKLMAGIDVAHVPYKGTPEAIADTIAGRVCCYFAPINAALPHLKGGKALALAVTSAQRSSLLPEVPTIAEAGMPQFSITSWAGLFGPARMPREVVERLNKEFAAAMGRADVQAAMEKQAFSLSPSSPDKLAAFVKEQMESYRRILRAAGVEPD